MPRHLAILGQLGMAVGLPAKEEGVMRVEDKLFAGDRPRDHFEDDFCAHGFTVGEALAWFCPAVVATPLMRASAAAAAFETPESASLSAAFSGSSPRRHSPKAV